MSKVKRTRARGEAVYRLLLRLYPRDFRRRYADDMIAFYRERIRRDESSRSNGVQLWFRLLLDLLASAVAERTASMTDRRRSAGSLHQFHVPREEPVSILQQDLRYAVRNMRHRPGFTAVILATLALGIGANAAIFSVVNAVLLRPLPFAHVERIVGFAHEAPYGNVSEAEFVDYQRGMPALSKLAGYVSPTATITVSDVPTRAVASRVTRDFFDIMGVRPFLGRTFAPDEYSHLAKTRLVIIGHSLWMQQFAGDPRVVGKTMRVNGNDATIVGVMPPGFAFPEAETAFWTPWRLNVDSLDTRNNHYLRMVGQLDSRATVEQARSQARTLESRWMHDFPETYFPSQPLVGVITPLRDQLLGPTRPYLLALLGAVAFILLIACVNVANLLLVRAESRRKEFAIRTALGASGNRMVRQMLTESMLYALMGAALGIGLAWLGVRAITLFAPSDLPRVDEIGVDLRVVGFTAAITLMTGVAF
ncbi:MAG TPA: ABC transporter permease, partial [Gemmatimonadaceae bacterium]|nr:ABC transporter permease [Gemmatimonadaceae bacterium]